METIKFVIWLGQNYPDVFYKYGEDDDQGEQAYKDLFEEFKHEFDK